MRGNSVQSDRRGNDRGEEEEGREDEIGGTIPCWLGFTVIPSSAH